MTKNYGELFYRGGLDLYILFKETKHSFIDQQNRDKSHFLASKVIFYKIFSNLAFYR